MGHPQSQILWSNGRKLLQRPINLLIVCLSHSGNLNDPSKFTIQYIPSYFSSFLLCPSPPPFSFFLSLYFLTAFYIFQRHLLPTVSISLFFSHAFPCCSFVLLSFLHLLSHFPLLFCPFSSPLTCSVCSLSFSFVAFLIFIINYPSFLVSYMLCRKPTPTATPPSQLHLFIHGPALLPPRPFPSRLPSKPFIPDPTAQEGSTCLPDTTTQVTTQLTLLSFRLH